MATPKKISLKTAFARQGWTGKLYGLNLVLTWTVTIICIILNSLSGILNIMDTQVYVRAIECAFAELGVFTAFIVWKAKAENCRKYKNVNLIEGYDENP